MQSLQLSRETAWEAVEEEEEEEEGAAEARQQQAGRQADKLLARATHFSSASSSPEFLVKSRCLSVDTCRASALGSFRGTSTLFLDTIK